MVLGSVFQHILAIVKQWWLSGLKINGQYALTECTRCQLIQYCSRYASKAEFQTRGSLHCHLLVCLHPRLTTALDVDNSLVSCAEAVEVD